MVKRKGRSASWSRWGQVFWILDEGSQEGEFFEQEGREKAGRGSRQGQAREHKGQEEKGRGMPQPSHARDARNLLVLSVVTAGFLDGALRWGGGLPGVMSERDDFGTGLLQVGGGSTQSHSAAVLPGGGETRGCKSDSECKAINSEWVCEGPASRGVCRHKHLLPLIDSADFAMLLLVFITIFISVPVGVGGGGILISIFLVVGRFCPHGAIPLTPPAIFGGALSNALVRSFHVPSLSAP
jgi:hypothetical protein